MSVDFASVKVVITESYYYYYYYVRTSVTLGVASSVANDVIMRTTAVGVSRAGSPASVWNDVIMRMTSQ